MTTPSLRLTVRVVSFSFVLVFFDMNFGRFLRVTVAMHMTLVFLSNWLVLMPVVYWHLNNEE